MITYVLEALFTIIVDKTQWKIGKVAVFTRMINHCGSLSLHFCAVKN